MTNQRTDLARIRHLFYDEQTGATVLEMVASVAIVSIATAAIAVFTMNSYKTFSFLQRSNKELDSRMQLINGFDCSNTMNAYSAFPTNITITNSATPSNPGLDCTATPTPVNIKNVNNATIVSSSGTTISGVSYRGVCEINRSRNLITIQQSTGGGSWSNTEMQFYCPQRYVYIDLTYAQDQYINSQIDGPYLSGQPQFVTSWGASTKVISAQPSGQKAAEMLCTLVFPKAKLKNFIVVNNVPFSGYILKTWNSATSTWVESGPTAGSQRIEQIVCLIP